MILIYYIYDSIAFLAKNNKKKEQQEKKRKKERKCMNDFTIEP